VALKNLHNVAYLLTDVAIGGRDDARGVSGFGGGCMDVSVSLAILRGLRCHS
jgi:hypothetical protein